MKGITRLIIVFLYGCLSLDAKVFPNLGEVFPIQEENILEMILKKLHRFEKSGKLEGFQKELSNKAQKAIERPKRVPNLKKTILPRTYTFDPTLILQTPVLLPGNKVLAPKGTRINPLSFMKFSKVWLFIDGDDEAQVQFALKEPNLKKIILINGAPLVLSEKHHIKFYFDQEGRLSEKFQLHQVPARISQDGSLLKIEEIKLEEGKEASS